MTLEDFRPMMDRCSYCLNCKWIPFDKIKSQRFGENCPSVSYYNFNIYSARGRFRLGQTLLDGEAKYTEKVVDAVHNCMACGSCDVTCKLCRYNLEPLLHNIELKRDAVKKGHVLEKQKEIISHLKKEKTMILSGEKATRTDWAKGLAIKNLSHESAEIAFFAGCKYSYNPKLFKELRQSVQILMAAGADLGILGNADNCCGGRLYQAGLQDEFNGQATSMIKAFQKSGVKMIVTPCSDCYFTLKRLYAEMGMGIEVLHVVEYLDRLTAEGKIVFTKEIPLTVTYHDPCHLGRLGESFSSWEGKEKKILNQIHTWEPRRPRYNGAYGIYDAPRNLLERIPGVKIVEMERIREYSWCCGAGGCISDTNPALSKWTAGERILEANATKADALVTACPWCFDNFDGVKDENGKSIPVMDILELIGQAMDMEVI